ncbi:MAG: hemerythrin domain-containing protein [archaeon]|nr:hemerythrin domain-containing protein [archaeon]MCP8306153.1 hemerythrin domain-containing protein [archaeon]
MIDLVKRELGKMREKKEVDPSFIDVVVDFFRTYADRCHHGKEEDILFRDLAKKQLSKEHRKIMDELIEEHIHARKTVGRLEDSKERYVQGKVDAFNDIKTSLKELTEFYPMHIEKEDGHFFYPSMEYFDKQELDDMLQEFWEFDRKMIHEKYEEIVERVTKLL